MRKEFVTGLGTNIPGIWLNLLILSYFLIKRLYSVFNKVIKLGSLNLIWLHFVFRPERIRLVKVVTDQKIITKSWLNLKLNGLLQNLKKDRLSHNFLNERINPKLVDLTEQLINNCFISFEVEHTNQVLRNNCDFVFSILALLKSVFANTLDIHDTVFILFKGFVV